MTDDDTAQRGRQDDLCTEVADVFGDPDAARLSLAGMLQHQRALQEPGAVESGRQPEMPLEQRSHASKSVENSRRILGRHKNRLVYIGSLATRRGT